MRAGDVSAVRVADAESIAAASDRAAFAARRAAAAAYLGVTGDAKALADAASRAEQWTQRSWRCCGPTAGWSDEDR